MTEEAAAMEAETEETETEETVTTEVIEEEVISEADLAKANEYYETGKKFFYGTEGNKIDYEEAYNNFQQAVELGNTDANFYLGALCDWNSYPKQDLEKARAYYEAAGENPYAYISLGYIYYGGQGIEEDKEKGKEYWEKAIALGCVDGYVGLATIVDMEEDYATAMEYYTKVVEEGTEQLYVSNAMKMVGFLYANGQGVEQDMAKALEWFEKAAALGEATAMNRIGYMYQNGQGVEQDMAKALEWFEKAAALGNTSAMNNIGYMYNDGIGVEQDMAKALEWYEKAAALGEATAMNNIGAMYQRGEGVEKDDAKALEWYEKAAALGHEQAKADAEALRAQMQ